MSTELSPEERRIVKSIQTAAMFLDEHIKETAQGFACEFKARDFQDLTMQLHEINFLLTQFDSSGKKRVADIRALYPSYTPRKPFSDAFVEATSINEDKMTSLVVISKLAEFFGSITKQMITNGGATEVAFTLTDPDASGVKKYLGGVIKKLISLGGSQ